MTLGTLSLSDLELIYKCMVIVLLMAWLLVRFARTCLCDNCKKPNAVYQRCDLQLCRECAEIYDKYMPSRYRRLLKLLRVGLRRAA